MMQTFVDFVLANWEWFLFGFFILEKLVKITSTKWDDILLDILWNGLKKLIGKTSQLFGK